MPKIDCYVSLIWGKLFDKEKYLKEAFFINCNFFVSFLHISWRISIYFKIWLTTRDYLTYDEKDSLREREPREENIKTCPRGNEVNTTPTPNQQNSSNNSQRDLKE